MNQVMTLREEGQKPVHLFEQSVRVEDPALADGEEEEDGDDAESSLHLGSHRPSLGPPG